jgi:CRP/FNR family transcriptional regulator, anaerobic regulatory protein
MAAGSASEAIENRTHQPCHPVRETTAFLPHSEEERKFLNSLRLGERVLEAGETLIPEHSRGGELYTLLNGWGFRFKTLSDGRRQILNFLLPGDFIGLQHKMDVATAHGVQMLTPARVCRYARDSLWAIFKSQPGLAYNIVWLAAHEESLVDESLLSVGRRSAAESIAALLVTLYRRARPLYKDEGDGIPFPVTQQHISDALGLSLVHTNKTLRRLEGLGFHKIENGRLSILNAKAVKTPDVTLPDAPTSPRRII